MERRWQPILGWGLAIVVLAALGWQTLTIAELKRRVAGLEQRDGTVESVSAGSRDTPVASVGAAGVHMEEIRSDQDVGGDPEVLGRGEAEAMLAVAVEEALERRDQDRTVQKAERWADYAADRIERVVGEAVDEQLFSAHLEEQVVALMLREVHHTSQLKVDVSEGDRTEEQAMEDYKTSRQETEDALIELIGEEATQELGDRMRQGRFGGK